jgi:hypothetical protein
MAHPEPPAPETTSSGGEENQTVLPAEPIAPDDDPTDDGWVPL